MAERIFGSKPTTSQLTPELIGLWRVGGRTYGITEFAYYVVYQEPLPFKIEEPHLNWDGWVFKRLMGDPGSLVGVWQEPSTGEDVYFRADGSLTWHDPNDGVQLTGNWKTTSHPDKLGASEARAFLVEHGNRLTFYSILSGEFTYRFKVSKTELVLTDPINHHEVIYTRVTP